MKRPERTEQLRLRLRKSERKALEAIATRDDEPMSAVVRRALRFYIEQAEGDAEGARFTGRATRKRKGPA